MLKFNNVLGTVQGKQYCNSALPVVLDNSRMELFFHLFHVTFCRIYPAIALSSLYHLELWEVSLENIVDAFVPVLKLGAFARHTSTCVNKILHSLCIYNMKYLSIFLVKMHWFQFIWVIASIQLGTCLSLTSFCLWRIRLFFMSGAVQAISQWLKLERSYLKPLHHFVTYVNSQHETRQWRNFQ